MRARTGLGVVGHLVALAACSDGGVAPPDLEGPCAPPAVSSTGWETVERGGFSFRLPPGFASLDLQPIDSDAQVYARPDGVAHLSHDFGIYTRELTDFDCVATIGGAPARVRVITTPTEIFVVARWRDLGSPSSRIEEQNALLMVGSSTDPALLGELLAAIHSVRIRTD